VNTTATEPVAWDPKGTLDPDTSIAALRAMGFAVATTGLDPVASALIGVATAEPGPDDPDGAALWTMPDIGIRTRGGVTTWAVPIHPDRPVDPADPRVRAALRRSGLTVDALRDGYPWDTMRRHVEDELHRDGTPCPAVAEYGKITVTHHAGFHIAVLAARGIVPPPTCGYDAGRQALGLAHAPGPGRVPGSGPARRPGPGNGRRGPGHTPAPVACDDPPFGGPGDPNLGATSSPHASPDRPRNRNGRTACAPRGGPGRAGGPGDRSDRPVHAAPGSLGIVVHSRR
jgi:hypothetical protein